MTTTSTRRWSSCATPVVRSARRGRAARSRRLRERAARRPAPRSIGAGLHPARAFGDVVHVADAALRAHRRARCADCSSARRPRALHVHVGMPDAETAIARLQPAARPPAAAAGAGRPLAVLARARLRLRHRARSMLFRGFPRATIPRAVRRLGPLRGLVERRGARPASCPTTRTCGGTCARTRGWARSRCGRWTRRAGWTAVAGLAALVHALARAAPTAHEGDWPPREALMESSFRAAATAWTRRCWWRGRCARCARSRARALALARPYAAEPGDDALEDDRADPARGRRRRPHARGPRARRDARCSRCSRRSSAPRA